jgi:hypothetical protein
MDTTIEATGRPAAIVDVQDASVSVIHLPVMATVMLGSFPPMARSVGMVMVISPSAPESICVIVESG